MRLVLILMLFSVVPICANAKKDADKCTDENANDPDKMIRYCSAAIDSGRLSNDALVAALLQRGLAYFNKAQYDRSIQDYNQVLQTDPSNSIAFYSRGLMYVYKGDYDHALPDFNEAIRLNPNFAEAFSNRGDAYTAKGNFDLAFQDYDRAIQINPNLAMAFYGRGNAYNQKADYDRAIKDLDEALRLSPGYALALVARGFAYDRKDDYDRAMQDYNEALRLNPNDSRALVGRGSLYEKKGEYQAAITDLDEALRLNPNDANALFDRGTVHFYLGEFDDAQPDLANLTSYSYAAIWFYLAQARAGQPAPDKLAANTAKLDLNVWPGPVINLYLGRTTPQSVLAAANSTDPKKDREQHCEAYFYLGQKALLDGKLDQAKALFQQALQTHVTSFLEYMGSQAELQRSSADAVKQCHDPKDPDSALSSCSEAIDNAHLAGAKLAMAYAHRGNAYLQKGQYDRAIQDYDQAIQLKPKETKPDEGDALSAFMGIDASALENAGEIFHGSLDTFANAFTYRGIAYADKGDYDRALQDYAQALQIVPDDDVALASRGDVYLRKGDFERAIQDYDKAIKPDSAMDALRGWTDHRGFAHFYLSQFDAAQKDFAASLAGFPVPRPSPTIWLYLARARGGQSAQDELAKGAATLNLKDWPGPVINFYLGKTSPALVLAAARSSDPKKDREQRCEAYFFMGEKALLEHKSDEARRLFQQAVDARSDDSYMNQAAQVELRR